MRGDIFLNQEGEGLRGKENKIRPGAAASVKMPGSSKTGRFGKERANSLLRGIQLDLIGGEKGRREMFRPFSLLNRNVFGEDIRISKLKFARGSRVGREEKATIPLEGGS